jgi:hypothetical protein
MKVSPLQMRINSLEALLMKSTRTRDDAKFFVDFLESICKDFKRQFADFNADMHIQVYPS